MIRPLKLRRNYDVGTIWLGNRSHHFLSSKTQPHRLLVPLISDCQIDAHFPDNFITFIRPNQIYHHLWIVLFNKNYEYIMTLLFRQPSLVSLKLQVITDPWTETRLLDRKKGRCCFLGKFKIVLSQSILALSFARNCYPLIFNKHFVIESPYFLQCENALINFSFPGL